MSNGLSWSSVELQLENLVPGIVLSVEILAWRRDVLDDLAAHGFIGGLAFVSVSYALGLVSAIVSRAVLDSISEWRLRSCVFGNWAHVRCDDAFEMFQILDSKFAMDYELEKMKRSAAAAKWNSIYRSAVRTTTRKNDVDRRRAQGRLTRNLMFPLVVGGIHFGQVIASGPTEWVASIVGALVCFMTSCALYSYSELIVMAEAFDISTGPLSTQSDVRKG